MIDKDIRKLLLAARNNDSNQVNQDLVPGWDYAHLCRIEAYCYDKKLIQASEVTNNDSPQREFLVLGITSEGEDVLKGASFGSRTKVLAGWAGGAIALLAGIATIWPFVLSLLHRLAHLFR